MSLTFQQVKDAASGLPESQRAELAEFLLSSLGEQCDENAQTAWLALAEQRMTELRSGKVLGIPAEQVLKNLLAPRQ